MTDLKDPVTTTYLTKTRIAYDVMAGICHEMLVQFAPTSSWDIGVLQAFLDEVEDPVIDVGCGLGHIAGYLADFNREVSGVDLSPLMVALAERTYPAVDFEVGSLFDLDCEDGSFGGVVAWNSLVHTPATLLPAAFAEFFRVLTPGGRVLIAFPVGAQRKTMTCAFGHEIDLEMYEFPIELMTDLLAEAGFEERARVVRTAEDGEEQPQAYVLGVKPSDPADQEAVTGGDAEDLLDLGSGEAGRGDGEEARATAAED